MSQNTMVFLFRYGAGEHVNFLPALPELCCRLQQEGWHCEHLGFKSDEVVSKDLSKACTIHNLFFRVNRAKRFDKFLKAFLWLSMLPWLGWRLQRRGVHTVFVDETLPLSAFLLRLFYQGRLCFTVHDFFTDIYLSDRWWTRGVGRWIKRRDAKDWKRLDLLFVRVSAAKEYLISLGVSEERIHVIPDSVDTDLFAPGASEAFRAQWGIAEEDVVLMHHGILHPNKGNIRLLEAFAAICDEVSSCRLVLIGDGSEMPYLCKKVEELGVEDQVILTGWLPGLADIADALRAADIGLVMRLGLPGDDFHVTSTLVHNLASGLPILGVRLKGIEETITEGKEGLLFDPECGSEFRDHLKTLVENKELRGQMAKESRSLAETQFARERIAKEYVKRLC